MALRAVDAFFSGEGKGGEGTGVERGLHVRSSNVECLIQIPNEEYHQK